MTQQAAGQLFPSCEHAIGLFHTFCNGSVREATDNYSRETEEVIFCLVFVMVNWTAGDV